MELACGMGAPSMPATVVSELNQQELAAARATFKAKKLLGDQQDIDKELEELMQELTNRQNEFIEINRSKTLKAIENGKTAYDKAIEDVKKDTLLCVHALDLKQIHDDAVAAALRVFNENRKSGHDGQDADRDKFSKDLTEKYAALNQMNDQNNRVMAAELKQEYSEYIMRKINNVPNLCDNMFAGEHQKARKKALEEFESRRTLHNSYNEDVYKTNMLQAIDRQYLQASQLNASANKELFKTALIVFNENSLKLRDLRKYCLHRHALRREHNSTKEITLNMISPKQLCGDSNRILLEMMENHYEEMKAINDSANEQAVTSAYWAYQSKYDSLSSHWYWAFTSWDTAWEYHQEALGVAFDRFFERRRGGRTYSDGYDVFLNNLEEKCKWYYRNS
ncbi:Uncharacterized protein OBRU01_02480 [Operophtera brumata]|uniref:Uncharacterized protein n=1 Tax=Operophtera brumata TaxID=104452 RepID=A0A0L7LSC3_OPEBR|nr:Uncharacterized protein OBRU01_02480 [Operophtera brumata]